MNKSMRDRPRDEEIAELRRLLVERDAIIERQALEIARLAAEVTARKEALGKSSKSSSKPPSSDVPGAKVRRRKRASGRKPGGQPGHKKHERELVPVEDVQEVVPCIPER